MFAGCVTSSAPHAAPSPKTTFTIVVAGQQRTYALFRPANLPASQQVPLVIAMHGYGGSATTFEARTGLDQSAQAGGFAVAYPDGLTASWNAGVCCGDSVGSNVDDVGFISRLIDELIAQGGVDPKRVYATGFSNGAFMAHRLACDLADKITAVASVAGGYGSPCHPSRPISVLEMHGTDDQVVPMLGGDFGSYAKFPATMTLMSQWASRDGCSATPAATQTATLRTTTWSGCRGGTIVRLDAVVGGEHDWFPTATDTVWAFFNTQK
jgi:polyhydroxybutyrate depolymerase